ncbi:MAG TPA: CPBP family intramembrane glutamic endopeptidase [Candidatus Acidoferrales bacterium]
MLSFAIMPWDFIIIFLILGVFVPWRGSVRVRKLLAQPALSTTDRLSLYASTIAFQWLAAFIVAWRSFAGGLTASDLALGSFASKAPAQPSLFHAVLATLFLTAFLCTTQFLALRRMPQLPPERRAFVQQMATKIFPQIGVEKLAFAALCATVALCEEFLYRGFAFAAIQRATHGMWAASVLGSSILFAAAHLYQGRRGLFSTFLIGVVFASVRAFVQSLAPSIVAHFSVDLLGGLLAPKFFVAAAASSGEAPAASAGGGPGPPRP